MAREESQLNVFASAVNTLHAAQAANAPPNVIQNLEGNMAVQLAICHQRGLETNEAEQTAMQRG